MVNLITFAKNRFSRKVFVGLPLTIIILLCVGMVLTFNELSEEVTSDNVIVQMDYAVTDFLYNKREAGLSYAFLWVTYFGGSEAISIIALGLSLIFVVIRKRLYILSLFLTLVGMSTTVYAIKLLIARDRPGKDIAYYLEDTFSFPSGHSAGAIALYGFVVYILLRHTKNKLSKALIVLGGSLVIALIGVSRLYLGVHYTSDVIGGFIIGLVWLLIAVIVTELTILHRKKTK